MLSQITRKIRKKVAPKASDNRAGQVLGKEPLRPTENEPTDAQIEESKDTLPANIEDRTVMEERLERVTSNKDGNGQTRARGLPRHVNVLSESHSHQACRTVGTSKAETTLEKSSGGSCPDSEEDSEERNATDRLAHRLKKSMQQFGINGLEGCLLDEVQNDLIDRPTIRRVMPNASNELLDFVMGKALKLFVVTMLVFGPYNGRETITSVMKSFERHGADDSMLPIPEIGQTCVLNHEETTPKHISRKCSSNCDGARFENCSHKQQLNVFHHRPWNLTTRLEFFNNQWKVLVPKFDKENFVREYRAEEILPITDMDPRLKGSGYFSFVHKARIPASHQNILPLETRKGKDGALFVAIKEIKVLEHHSYNIEREFKREADAFMEFNSLNHKHIVRGIAAVKQSAKYYIILEWADGGNLRTLWETHPKPDLNGDIILDVLNQACGLAGALCAIHNNINLDNRTEPESAFSDLSTSDDKLSLGTHSASAIMSDELAEEPVGPDEIAIMVTQKITPPTTPRAQNEGRTLSGDDAGPNWRLGDVKPDNILRFLIPNRNDTKNSLIGCWKLADFGRARKHKVATNLRKAPTDEQFGTRKYEPPEAVTLEDGGKRSRLYDIWSMGCVLFETIYWLLYGIQNREDFDAANTLSNLNTVNTPYWTLEKGDRPTARVNDIASGCIEYMLEHDPECNQPTGTALGDLVKIIRDKLLVVQLPESAGHRLGGKVRTNSRNLQEELDKILDRCQTDKKYLFTGTKRELVKPPPIPQQTLQKPEICHNDIETSPNTAKSPMSSTWLVAIMKDHNGWRTYTHSFTDIWVYQVDDEFARLVLRRRINDRQRIFPTTASPLCSRCALLDFRSNSFKTKDTLSELHERAGRGCHLCGMLFREAAKFKIPQIHDYEFELKDSGLRLNESGPLSFSICRPNKAEIRTTDDPYIRIGLPRLPEPWSKGQFATLRAWVEDCDDKHEGCQPDSAYHDPESALPTRLLDLDTGDSNVIRLIPKISLDMAKSKTVKYIALSHPWGKLDEHQYFCTYTSNLQEYTEDGININRLPNTFRDAVAITRQLGERYLWIDSLCIVQGEDGDFKHEAEKMESVFSSAYFVIAASSALGMMSGILGPRPDRQFVTFKGKGEEHRPLYICEYWDTFQEDVLDGPLCKRGWALQERALARRTMFFTNKQVYWECGEGIRCETLTKMMNTMVAFLGDPNFPRYGVKASMGGQLYLFQQLYEQYSRLAFTYPEDRATAIRGLEQRLARSFNCRGAHGVFERDLKRSLLWRRAGNPLTKIRFNPGSNHGRRSPTWSWMSFQGEISYIAPGGRTVDWDEHVKWPKFNNRHNINLEGLAKRFLRPKALDQGNKDLIFDESDEPTDIDSLLCVVIGTETTKKRCYVIFVRVVRTDDDGRPICERAGIGYLPPEMVQKSGYNVLIQ